MKDKEMKEKKDYLKIVNSHKNAVRIYMCISRLELGLMLLW